MRGMLSRLLGDWEGALAAYADAAAADDGGGGGGGGGELPDILVKWLNLQFDELRALQQQQLLQQQQQQQQYAWQRTRSIARLTPPGGNSGIYISIVMVGRHDNTQVSRDHPSIRTSASCARSFVSTRLTLVWTARGCVQRLRLTATALHIATFFFIMVRALLRSPIAGKWNGLALVVTKTQCVF
jgi:hypothetical protein